MKEELEQVRKVLVAAIGACSRKEFPGGYAAIDTIEKLIALQHTIECTELLQVGRTRFTDCNGIAIDSPT